MEAFLKMIFAVKRRQTIFAWENEGIESQITPYWMAIYIKRLRRETIKPHHCDSQHYVLYRRLYKMFGSAKENNNREG